MGYSGSFNNLYHLNLLLSISPSGAIDKTYVIIGSSVSGIIFIGLAVILVSRLLLELHYRREYRNFIKAQEQTVWKDVREMATFVLVVITTIFLILVFTIRQE